jgi:hypothetical protein
MYLPTAGRHHFVLANVALLGMALFGASLGLIASQALAQPAPAAANAEARAAEAAAGVNGRTATLVLFGPPGGQKRGDYRQIGPGQWAETGPDGSVRFQYVETKRDDWSVYLLDRSRSVKIQLDLFTRQVKYDDGSSPQRPLYHVQSAMAAGGSHNIAQAPVAQPMQPPAPPQSMQPLAGGPAGVPGAPLTDNLDPACLASAPWLVSVRNVDLQLYGCRAQDLVPQPNATGWRHFDNHKGGYLETHVVSVDPTAGLIVFDVVYNGGGSGSFKSRVTGHPVQGVLKAGSFKVQ